MTTETIQTGNQFNQELITKARKGEIAILNDGSVEELRELLKEVWPDDDESGITEGEGTVYFKDPHCSAYWDCSEQIDRTTHSIKDFFMTDTEIAERISQQSFQQPRTYKVTRQQMKEIWEAVPVISKQSIRQDAEKMFGVFENEAEITGGDVAVILRNFFEPIPDPIKSIFPEYFHIPEGEPVLCKRYNDDEWRIRVSDGKGGAYDLGLLSGEVKYFRQIIPFTKNPPK